MKNTLLFTYSTNIVLRLLTVNMKNCLTPQNLKMCDPILVTPLKMRAHYSQCSSENATPSNGTSPLASYKEVPPPPGNCNKLKLVSWGPWEGIVFAAPGQLANYIIYCTILYLDNHSA